MDDNWDLFAVVRGCAATVTTNTNPTAIVAASTSAAANNHFPCFPSILPLPDDRNTFAFSGLVDERDNPYQGLQEVYHNYCRGYPPPTAAEDISAANIMPVAPALALQLNQEFMQIKPPLQLNVQIQENVQFNTSPILDSPLQNSPTTITQPIRSRRRKNQQIKTVRQMTQEELSADSWAWRKYGQKPIKGSPHPRNYYRCSTSKGCAARKQVERSSTDPEMFVVSYTGEHTHPRPTHRSSLAGSTRGKFASPFPAKGGRNNAAMLSQKGMMAFSSSHAVGPSFSPATPSMEVEAATLNDDDVQMVDEGAGDDDYENMIMPNDLMNDDDDIFRGFQDSDDQSSGGGGDFFSSGLQSSPPWTPTTSTFNGGGGD